MKLSHLTALDSIILQAISRGVLGGRNRAACYATGPAADADAAIMESAARFRTRFTRTLTCTRMGRESLAAEGMSCDEQARAFPGLEPEAVSEAVTPEGCVVISNTDETGTHIQLQGVDHE